MDDLKYAEMLDCLIASLKAAELALKRAKKFKREFIRQLKKESKNAK